MMTFKDWKMLQETTIGIGVASQRSIGIIGSKLAEMGLTPAMMSAEDGEGDNQDPTLDMPPAAPKKPSVVVDGDKLVIDIKDLDADLLKMLGVDISTPEDGMGMGMDMGGDADAQVGSDDGVDLDAMMSDLGADDATPEEGDDAAEFPPPAVDDDEEEGDDEEGSAPPFARKEPEEEGDEVEDDSEDGKKKPNPKFMHKGKGKKKEYMCGACGNVTKEEAAIFDSILKNYPSRKAPSREPGPGDVGFAPNNKIMLF